MSSSVAIEEDARLVDEAIVAIHEARRQAPRDYLLAIALLLGTISLILVVAGFVVSGVAGELFLNLGAEVVGALLTVVVIDGLWRRMERGTSASLDAMARRLESRRGQPMTDDEREAWRWFVEASRPLTGRRSLITRIRGVRTFAKDLHAMEERGNRTLEAFDPAHTATYAPDD